MRPPLIPQTIPIHEQELKYIRILKTLYNTLIDYREPKSNRIVVSIFMCLPSRKDFPEYFDIIQRPISMYEIRKRIESSYYRSEDPCLDDFRLMFNNCRTFNEDGSVIYNDANNLEDMLMKKYSQLVPENERNAGSTTSRGNNTNSTTKSHASASSSSPFATTTSRSTTNTSSSPNRREEKYNNNHQQQQAPSPISTPGKRYSKKNSTVNSNNIHNNFNNNHQNHQKNSTPSHGQPNQFSHSNNFNSNGLTSDADSNSNSNQFSSCNGNTNDSFIINHNFHNDASIDSNSNLSIGPNASTAPKTNEKPTKRQKRDPDAPKRRLLTGYIIYAAEVRKEYVDKHPNQDFGFISRLIGNDWKALPRDLRVKYEQRALVHNKKMREKAIMDSMMTTPDGQQQFSYHQNQQYPQHQQQAPSMTNGTSTPKLTKRKLAKLAKEQERLHNSSTPYLNHDNSFATPMRQHDRSSHMASQAANSSYRSSEYNYQRSYPYSAQQGNLGEQDTGTTYKVESSTQTAPFRFVEPPTPRRHAYAENFRRYIAGLDVPNMDLVEDETTCLDKPPEPVDTWLGAGIGRHESTEAALWALRDFLLQDSDTMRLNMQPYLCY